MEPFGETRNAFIVRSRECRFMLELEIVEGGGGQLMIRGDHTIGVLVDEDEFRCRTLSHHGVVTDDVSLSFVAVVVVVGGPVVVVVVDPDVVVVVGCRRSLSIEVLVVDGGSSVLSD